MITSAYHPFRSAEAKAIYLAQYDERAKAWPVPSETRLVDTSYGQTFVRISGPVDAPPLVLLPGAGSCSLMWLLNIAVLSECHRTYAVDMLINTGCVGRSVYTRHIISPDDVTQWLDELFNGLDLGNNINLLGASYGGWPASQYVLRCPDRLNKVVWVAPAGTVLPFSGEYLQQTIQLFINPSRDTYMRFFSWAFNDLAQKDSQLVEAIADEFMVSAQSLVSANPQRLPTLTALSDEELQRIHVPTLFLVGENEVLYPAQQAVQRLNDVAPQIRAEIIPHAGHDLFLVQTEMVNQKIVEFLVQS